LTQKENEKINQATSKLKEQLVGKMIKVATRNGVADITIGKHGESWRIRAGKRFEIKER
jgi:membrane protein implicated in regulation of membrane protease activity